MPREHLLRALTPLYLGRTAAFIVHVRAMPLGRIPTPEEIAETVVFYLSDLSSIVTGTMLDVNAGQFMPA